MLINQKDLLGEIDETFAKAFMDIAVKESYKAEHFLFREGDPASHFYILIKGHIQLSIGEMDHLVYVVNGEGETFGWSNLVGRDVYSASAECMKPTKLYKISNDDIQNLLEKDPKNGILFYKKLLKHLGDRLLKNYKNFTVFTSYFHV